MPRINRDINPQRRIPQKTKILNHLLEHGLITNAEARDLFNIDRGATAVIERLRKRNHIIDTYLDVYGNAVYVMDFHPPQTWSLFALMTKNGLKYYNEISYKDLQERELAINIKIAKVNS